MTMMIVMIRDDGDSDVSTNADIGDDGDSDGDVDVDVDDSTVWAVCFLNNVLFVSLVIGCFVILFSNISAK